MIGELKRIASKRKVYVIFVQADPWDSPAIALYESWVRRKLHIILTSMWTQRSRNAEEQVARNKQLWMSGWGQNEPSHSLRRHGQIYLY